MNVRHPGVVMAVLLVVACNNDLISSGPTHVTSGASSTIQLGRLLFFDQRLSQNSNQACAVCHGPEVGWTGPDEALNIHGSVYEGSIPGRFGNRKPTASSYSTMVPLFTFDPEQGFMGGVFWDGRATGWKLGNAAADQAQGPFLNPVEQALPSAQSLVDRVCSASYSNLFRQVWGEKICDDREAAFNNIALSIAAYEGSEEMSPFSSVFDGYLSGRNQLTEQQRVGLELFEGKAMCTTCHTSRATNKEPIPLFTDFSYENLGVPRNPENPFYRMDQLVIDGQPFNPAGTNWTDPGLAGFLETLTQNDDWRSLPHVTQPLKDMSREQLVQHVNQSLGKQRVPTLRNVDKRPAPGFIKAFAHNGYFKSLKQVVHFYNTRDVLLQCPQAITATQAMAQNCWPEPEVAANINREHMGNLRLTDEEEDALVAFLQTLSDR